MSERRLGPHPETPEEVSERQHAVDQMVQKVRSIMSGTVRAKFKVSEIIERQFTPTYSQKTIVLSPQYDQKVAEDVSFQKATPTGRMEMQIDNPVAIERMPIGKVFYVDFTPAE